MLDRRRFIAAASAALLVPSAARAAAPASPFIDDLTWIEVRDAVRAGTTVGIVPTGGSEQNGPQMAIGKHNLIVRHCAGEVARRLGNVLVAPVLAYVPEGDIDPPTANMILPGTIGVTEATFADVLTEAAASLAHSGFTLICFMGDHGLSQRPQVAVAATLTRQWRRQGVRVASLDHYYNSGGEAWLQAHGYSAAEIGAHGGLIDTAELLAVAPDEIRTQLLSPKSWPTGPTGAVGDPSRATVALGQQLIALKIDAAVAQIRSLEAAPATSP